MAVLMLLGACALSLLAEPAGAQQERPDPDALVEQAWRFAPAYAGEYSPFLSEGARRELTAATHLLEAALALAPEHNRALWSLGHLHGALAADRRSRGLDAPARAHAESAEGALGRALELQPEDPWACYERGLVRADARRNADALADFERAVGFVEERVEAGETQWAWLRYKTLERRAEALTRVGRYGPAREVLRAFHGEFSTNEWPLLIALAESHLRERDLEGARARYLEILERFPADHQAYALLAYVEGLRGERGAATARLLEALELEREPGLYTRLWLVVLATDEARATAVEDFSAFLENPPPGPTDWDVALGRFVLGEGDADAFLARMEDERARRIEASEALDGLECEAWFYIGDGHERRARALSDADERRQAREQALDAYRRALLLPSVGWKWEWAFARLRFAELARELGRGAAPELVAGAWRIPLDGLEEALVDARWHAPGAARPSERLQREPAPGDLVSGFVPRGVHAGAYVHFFVDAR